jgi:hypothetical protein
MLAPNDQVLTTRADPRSNLDRSAHLATSKCSGCPWRVAASWFDITALVSAGLCLRDEIRNAAYPRGVLIASGLGESFAAPLMRTAITAVRLPPWACVIDREA